MQRITRIKIKTIEKLDVTTFERRNTFLLVQTTPRLLAHHDWSSNGINPAR